MKKCTTCDLDTDQYYKVNDRICKSCIKKRQKDYYTHNKKSVREYQSGYYKSHKEYFRNKNFKYKKGNKEKLDKYNKDYSKKHYNLNKDSYSAKTAKRRTLKLMATPRWLVESDFKNIQNFYHLAEDCYKVSGEKYHVDHIVPLQGKNVCGLHVPWNLQVLPSDINLSKGNRI